VSAEDRAWAAMVRDLGDVIHTMPDLAEVLLPLQLERLGDQPDGEDVQTH
jgi:hypothetical protein